MRRTMIVNLPMARMLIIRVVFRRIPDRTEIIRSIHCERFPTHMRQVMCRLVPRVPVGGVLLVMSMMPVGPVSKRHEDLCDPIHVDEEKRENRECTGRGQRSSGGAAEMRLLVRKQRDDLAKRDLA